MLQTLRTLETVLFVCVLVSTSAFAGTTERVSVDSAGTEANNTSCCPSVSADGRYVAFDSSASNLVADDNNFAGDIFVHDRLNGTTERVSVDSAGTEANTISLRPSISADGRYVAFNSNASNLVAGDTNGVLDVFVRDRLNGTTERVSVDSSGNQINDFSGSFTTPSISADGRYVVFHSIDSHLVIGDTNGFIDVFVRDRLNGTTERVSVDSVGNEANANSSGPSISADGRFVAFWSNATNLVAGDAGGADVFVHDRLNGTTERVSVDSAGNGGGDGSAFPSISADGRYVTFESGASDLVPGDTNNLQDIFMRDRATGTTERVSVDSFGSQTNGLSNSGKGSISADGRFVVFDSQATNLVAGDTNGVRDVFVHDRGPIEPMEPSEVLEDIAEGIENLASDNVLTEDQVDGLNEKLLAAIDSLNNEKDAVACKQLTAFINQIVGLVEAGQLNALEGEDLIDEVEALKAEIGCD